MKQKLAGILITLLYLGLIIWGVAAFVGGLIVLVFGDPNSKSIGLGLALARLFLPPLSFLVAGLLLAHWHTQFLKKKGISHPLSRRKRVTVIVVMITSVYLFSYIYFQLVVTPEVERREKESTQSLMEQYDESIEKIRNRRREQ